MWQESNPEQQSLIGTMTDVVFRIECPRLYVDHATALSEATCKLAPLLKASRRAGIHAIHVAGSQNGWERPESASDVLLLSKRTRFQVRVEKDKAQSLIELLEGETLDVNGFPLHIISGQARPISPATTLLSRYTFFEDITDRFDEAVFIQRVIDYCSLSEFTPTKILCGREHTINSNAGPRLTRSVLLADIPASASTRLQDNGLGHGRAFGCGMLIPHKDTGAVHGVPE